MKRLMAAFIVMATFAFAPNDELSGRWESISETGAITGVLFKPGNTFEGYVNKKPFVTATYTYSSADSIISFVDNGCDGIRGTYKVNFYSNSDSMRFICITDSCKERKEGMRRLNFGKVKE